MPGCTITLLHWNAAEGAERTGLLRKLGYSVNLVTKIAPSDLASFASDAIVIDLSRLPSHGREVAGAIRRRKSTRLIPIVFVGGEADKVARARELMPDARYTEWPRIGDVLEDAIRDKPKEVVVPGTMAGYSGTPLPKKLGMKPGSKVALINAPKDFLTTLGTLPDNVVVRKDMRSAVDLAVVFAKSRAELERSFPEARDRFWIAWPKKTSGVASDLTETGIREYGMARGFVDFKVCAIDLTWSGLCFARRK